MIRGPPLDVAGCLVFHGNLEIIISDEEEVVTPTFSILIANYSCKSVDFSAVTITLSSSCQRASAVPIESESSLLIAVTLDESFECQGLQLSGFSGAFFFIFPWILPLELKL